MLVMLGIEKETAGLEQKAKFRPAGISEPVPLPPIFRFSERDLEILIGIARGEPYREIAGEGSEQTVKNRMWDIYNDVGIRTAYGVVDYAISTGQLDVSDVVETFYYSKSTYDTLTPRQKQVLRAMAQDEDIGASLNIAKNTVRNHLKAIDKKLGLKGKKPVQAGLYARFMPPEYLK